MSYGNPRIKNLRENLSVCSPEPWGLATCSKVPPHLAVDQMLTLAHALSSAVCEGKGGRVPAFVFHAGHVPQMMEKFCDKMGERSKREVSEFLSSATR